MSSSLTSLSRLKMTGKNKANPSEALSRPKETGSALIQEDFFEVHCYRLVIHHAMMDENHPELEDARYVLVAHLVSTNCLVVNKVGGIKLWLGKSDQRIPV